MSVNVFPNVHSPAAFQNLYRRADKDISQIVLDTMNLNNKVFEMSQSLPACFIENEKLDEIPECAAMMEQGSPDVCNYDHENESNMSIRVFESMRCTCVAYVSKKYADQTKACVAAACSNKEDSEKAQKLVKEITEYGSKACQEFFPKYASAIKKGFPVTVTAEDNEIQTQFFEPATLTSGALDFLTELAAPTGGAGSGSKTTGAGGAEVTDTAKDEKDDGPGSGASGLSFKGLFVLGMALTSVFAAAF